MSTPEPGTLFNFEIPQDKTKAKAADMRSQFIAIACLNYTTDAAFPKNPRPGMPRVLASDPTNVQLQIYYVSDSANPASGAWRTFIQNLQLALPAPAKFVSAVPSSNPWTVNHNLGSYPIVDVIDAGGYRMQALPQGGSPGAGQYTLLHVSLSRFVVTFSGATAGTLVYIG